MKMSTRAIVGKRENEDRIRCIAIQHDGYPGGVGNVLNRSYSTAERIDLLLLLGNLSSLNHSLGDSIAYSEQADTIEGPEDAVFEMFIQYAVTKVADFAYLFQNDRWQCWSISRTNVEQVVLDEASTEVEAEDLSRVTLKNVQSGLHYIAGQVEAIESVERMHNSHHLDRYLDNTKLVISDLYAHLKLLMSNTETSKSCESVDQGL
jgi:hypothetical protein